MLQPNHIAVLIQQQTRYDYKYKIDVCNTSFLEGGICIILYKKCWGRARVSQTYQPNGIASLWYDLASRVSHPQLKNRGSRFTSFVLSATVWSILQLYCSWSGQGFVCIIICTKMKFLGTKLVQALYQTPIFQLGVWHVQDYV